MVLTDVIGRVITSEVVDFESGDNIIELSLLGESSGIYYLSVKGEDGRNLDEKVITKLK